MSEATRSANEGCEQTMKTRGQLPPIGTPNESLHAAGCDVIAFAEVPSDRGLRERHRAGR